MKTMKTTLIKDLYGEIERLKAGELLYCHVVAKVRITCARHISSPKYLFVIVNEICDFDQRFMLHVRKLEFIYQRKDTIRRRMKKKVIFYVFLFVRYLSVAILIILHIFIKSRTFVPCNFQLMRSPQHYLFSATLTLLVS